MDQDADEPSDERGVADGAFTNGRSIAATRLSQTFAQKNTQTPHFIMNTIKPLFIVLFPVIALAFAMPNSFGAEMPHGIQTLIDKRKEAIRKIDKVFIEELEKVKTAYVKAGDLEKANLAAELIKSTSVIGTDEVFSLDGEWRYRIDGKAVSIVRRFKGNKMIDAF